MDAIAYVRFSTDMQRDESIMAQKRAISYYANEKGINIIKFYEDKAISGKSANRPGFLAMVEHVKRGGIGAVICHKLDRLSRSIAISASFQQVLSDYDVKLISVMENLDSSPSGNLMRNIITAINSFYIDNLASEISKGMTENAYQCITTGGIPPLGYDIVDKKYVVNEHESQAVRLMFEMYDNGIGYNTIITKLNSLGYKTKKGNAFGKNSLYEIFRNERYKGTYVFNKAHKRKSDGRRSRKQKPDSEIIRIEGGVPAIVDVEIWQRVNDKMNKNKHTSGSYKAKERYLLSGLIYCGECGYAMHGNGRFPSPTREKYISYRCNRRDNNKDCNNREIKRDEVEDFVINQLERYLFNDSIIPELTIQLNQYIKDSANQSDNHKEQYEKHLKQLELQKKNIVDAVALTGLEDAFCSKLEEIQGQIVTVKENLSNLQTNEPSKQISEEKVREYLAAFNQFVKSRDIPQIKKFIDSYIERVDVFGDRVKVTMKILFAIGSDDKCYSFDVDSTRNNIKTA